VERRLETGPVAASLDSLTVGELAALRLSAQVMAHKADLGGSQSARLFFESLESAVMAEQAGRSQSESGKAVDASSASVGNLLRLPASQSDRDVITDSLELLAANERLAPAVRLFCRRLSTGVPARRGDRQ
jgi:hypothetical protein